MSQVTHTYMGVNASKHTVYHMQSIFRDQSCANYTVTLPKIARCYVHHVEKVASAINTQVLESTGCNTTCQYEPISPTNVLLLASINNMYQWLLMSYKVHY